jgi:H+/Cl- antiporter ClcA
MVKMRMEIVSQKRQTINFGGMISSILDRLKQAWLDNEPSRWVRWLQRILGGVINNPQLRKGILQAIPFWIASVVTGLIAVGYAALFGLAEKLSRNMFIAAEWSIFISMPIAFIAGWWTVKRFAPAARGSGIPQVVAAIELGDAHQEKRISMLLSFRIIVVKVVSSFLMVLGGAAIGREGPTIQVAASVFRKVNEWLPKWWPKVSTRIMIMTGAAAGLAAAFNTPLGGIVFVVEELTKTHFSKFRTAIFTAVIIAGLTAEGISGPYLYLGYPQVAGYTLGIFWGVLLVAVLGGLLGAMMSKAILKILAWKRRLKTDFHNIAYLLVTSIAVASITYFVTDQAMGSGKDLISHVLFSADKTTEWYVPAVRMVGPVGAFTSGAAGGVFAPSLSTGASLGASIATAFGMSAPNANVLILAGMVAFLTGVTRSPFTSAILVLEMTDRHSLIFHLMAAAMVANLFAYLIDSKSLYEHLKERFIEYTATLETEDPEKKDSTA